MNFPTLSEPKRLEMLQPPTRQVRMVLDTDTYNEIDDQFAVVHALLSAERLTVEALYAAPFHNSRSEGPEDGMEQSYTEILRVLERLGVPAERLVYRGARSFLCHKKMPVSSDAANDLVERAFTATTEQPLYVVAVGAITNVASALLMDPEILRQIVVIWLGGNPLYWSHTREFNLMQDIRQALRDGRWTEFRQEFHARYRIPNQTARHAQRTMGSVSKSRRRVAEPDA